MKATMEPLALDADIAPVEDRPIPLDETTEWSAVIDKKIEAEKRKAEEERQLDAERIAQERREAEEAAKEREYQAEAERARKAVQRHHRKVIGCFTCIVAMIVLSGASFALQYAGYIKFPWSIVITGSFGAVAAFFAGIVWETCSKHK